MTVAQINARIGCEFSASAADALTDAALMDVYLASNAMKRQTCQLANILSKHGVDDATSAAIISDYSGALIQPSLKGQIRGTTFNKIVEACIIDMHLNQQRFEVAFETKCTHAPTDEIPDWFIREKATDRVIVGMNQLDLWSGGQQSNRGSKYILRTELPKGKLVAVVCNRVRIKNTHSKMYRLFDRGFRDDTLCYLGALPRIITDYFDASADSPQR